MNISKFFDVFNIPQNERIVNDRLWATDDEEQNIYEINSLGLQLWVNDFNNIVTIICSEDTID